MPLIGKNYELGPDERGQPIVWIEKRELPSTPDTSDEVMEAVMKNRGLKSFGHKHDKSGRQKRARVHFLGSANGVALHTDPGFERYSHHMIVRNDGFLTTGFDGEILQPLEPGTIYCLDTYSPHTVVLDERMLDKGNEPRFKLDICVDDQKILKPDGVWNFCTRFLEVPLL